MYEAIATFRKRLKKGDLLMGAGIWMTDPQSSEALAQIPHLRLLGWLLWAYSRCGVSTGVLIGFCAASLRGLATVSRQLWSLSG